MRDVEKSREEEEVEEADATNDDVVVGIARRLPRSPVNLASISGDLGG